MTRLFGYSLDTIALALLIVSAALLLLMALLAVRRPVLARIALRQVPRRRAQMVLVALGLSLGASIITSVFLTGDTVQTAIHIEVVAGLGGTDEILHDASGPYTRGDVDIGTLTGLDTGAANAATQAVFLDELSGRLVTQGQPRPEVYFPQSVAATMQARLAGSTVVRALLGDAVEHHALLTDQTTRQIRGEVKVIGLPSALPAVFGVPRDAQGHPVPVSSLPAGAAVINAVAAQDLGAQPGDSLLLFLQQKSFHLRLRAIIANGGLAGATPAIVLPLAAVQTMMHQPGEIDRILVANQGADQAAAAANSGAATNELYAAAPYNLAVDQAKAEGLRQADQAQEIFSRIFTLFALFAAGVGLLLVFLIFTILAAERRPEMGIGRVVGMRRRDLVLLYLFEGTAYALASAGLGVGLGVGIGASIVGLLNRVLNNYGFGIDFVVHSRVVAIAYGLGLLATWLTVVLACWWATRLTISSAIRDLPEPEQAPPSLLRRLFRAWGRLRRTMAREHRLGARLRVARKLAFSLPLSWLRAVVAFCIHGPGLLVLGLVVARLAADAGQSSVFAMAVTVALLGTAPTVRLVLQALQVRARIGDRIAFTLAGLLLVAYWSLPASAPAQLGLPPLQSGIEIFFLAGVTMVLGAVWIAMYNLDAVLRPLATALGLPGKLAAAARTAAAYTLHRPARTGLILAMFALVSFTLTVMEVVTDALQRDYGDVAAQTGGFDIRGDLLFNAPITDLKGALRRSPYVDARAFSFAGSQGYEPVGVVQLSAPQPAWQLAYMDVLDGDFLQGTTFHLLARAHGYASDAAVWAALRGQPGLAIIGSDLLPGGNPIPIPSGAGIPPPYVLDAPTDPGFAPVAIWLADPRGGQAIKLRVIGVADDADGRHGGLILPAQALVRGGIPPVLATQYYRVRPGQDVTRQARAIGSAFLEHGVQTTVLVNAVWAQHGPKILLARLLQGFVGLVLLLGIAGLAATALRSVVERRQQIGMMRALGMPRGVIRIIFLLESSMVALAGLGIGVGLGLLLARNLFLADFFEQYQTGLTMQVPWLELGLIVGATYLIAMLATVLPAVLAGRVSPVEALMDH